jgi:hypothetical protein
MERIVKAEAIHRTPIRSNQIWMEIDLSEKIPVQNDFLREFD